MCFTVSLPLHQAFAENREALLDLSREFIVGNPIVPTRVIADEMIIYLCYQWLPFDPR